MESITDEFLYIVVGFLIGYLIVIGLAYAIRDSIAKDRLKEKDENIEWYGPDIYFKEKIYSEIKDDFRDELIDRDKYIEDEKRRQDNVRNNTGNSGTNKVDGTGFGNNDSEDENKGT